MHSADNPPPDNSFAVRIEDLEVNLGHKQILRGIRASLRRGRITALIGPNGAGKSTLVRSLLGIIPAAKGRVEIAGRELSAYSPRELARTVGFVPQETHLDFSFKVSEIVMMARYPHLEKLEQERSVDREAVDRALEQLALEDFARRDITTLSAGERQRVLLARALATGANILVADEPVSALDVGHRLEVFELLARRVRSGLTAIVVLHDLELALRFADDTILLHQGRVVKSGDPLPVLTSPELERVFRVRVEKLADGKSLYFHSRI